MTGPGVVMSVHALEEKLRSLGISIVSGQQDTIHSIKIKGLAGKKLLEGLRLADQLITEKVKLVLKTSTDNNTKLFVDPTFGPSQEDPQGASALCKAGQTIPSKGGSQHQVKILGLLKSEKIRWERPLYANDDEEEEEDEEDGDNQDEGDEEESSYDATASSNDKVFATQARLFSDGVSSGDVIQGNLGDCWFLSALSVVATRSDLLEQAFWRGESYKSKGLFICRFMKNFVWNYVVIDDRIPVFGFGKNKEGKPYFARCRDPNELWVTLLEKAYAKLHGSYESLIGGFIDVALNDLSGLCSEQVIMKEGFPGFAEDPFAPVKPQQKRGDPFWEKLSQYKESGTLMGCSIQPPPTGDRNVAAESSAGNGLYFKHAYSLVDAGEIKTISGETVRLVKLRNPWGMGEWTGAWSDASEERNANQDVIEQFFKVLNRKIGSGNASRNIFLDINKESGLMQTNEMAAAQEEVFEVNQNDGTFFMSYDAWMQYFTHFFAGIDFPDKWHGRRVEGCWDETSCGGNITKTTWLNNPRFELILETRSRLFISLSQEDPRGKENLKIVPIGFHLCSLTESQEKNGKYELKEPTGKREAYYRLYKEKDRIDFQKGIRPEILPPSIIPGSVIPGIDEDGVPQPAYTFKQAVSVDVTLEAGKYCIIPSMYMRTDKDTGKTNVGSFWISVYSEEESVRLQGGEKIAEEEEASENDLTNIRTPCTSVAAQQSSAALASVGLKSTPIGLSQVMNNSPGKKSGNGMEKLSSNESGIIVELRRRFEDAKEEFLDLAKSKGIGLREFKKAFHVGGSSSTTSAPLTAKNRRVSNVSGSSSGSGAVVMKKQDVRKKLINLGFKNDEIQEEKIHFLFAGIDAGGDHAAAPSAAGGLVQVDHLFQIFENEIEEDRIAADKPEIENDDVPEKLHQEGLLELCLHGAKDLNVTPALSKKDTSHAQQQNDHLLLVFPRQEYSSQEQKQRKELMQSIVTQSLGGSQEKTILSTPLLTSMGFKDPKNSNIKNPKGKEKSSNNSGPSAIGSNVSAPITNTPVQELYEKLDKLYHPIKTASSNDNQSNKDTEEPEEVTSNAAGGSSIAQSAPTTAVTSPLRVQQSNRQTHTDAAGAAAMQHLHQSDRMKELEKKRQSRLLQLQKKKQEALGDKLKTSTLPRLIGGRKSGSSVVYCIDCGERLVLSSKSELTASLSVSKQKQKQKQKQQQQKQSEKSITFACTGSACVNVFCVDCFVRLPEKQKYCEECFEHEHFQGEERATLLHDHEEDVAAASACASRLRNFLIKKITSSPQQLAKMEEIFRAFDQDQSGELTRKELEQALEAMKIQPPLNDLQMQVLLNQFDTNKDGKISMEEFQNWLMKDQLWKPPVEPINATITANKVTPEIMKDTIQSMVHFLLDTAYDAFVFGSSTKHWLSTENCSKRGLIPMKRAAPTYPSSSSTSNHDQVLFQRVMSLRVCETSSETFDSQAVLRIFERFDTDKSGSIELDEFLLLAQELGLHLSKQDARLLMHRLEKSHGSSSFSSTNFNEAIDLKEFMDFVGKIQRDTSTSTAADSLQSTSKGSALVSKLLEIDTALSTTKKEATKTDIQVLLQSIHCNMRQHEVVTICLRLAQELSVHLEVQQLQRIASVFILQEDTTAQQPQQQEATPASTTAVVPTPGFKTSGDAISSLFFASMSKAAITSIKDFNLQKICDQLLAFFVEKQQQSTATMASTYSSFNVETAWRFGFGLDPSESLQQKDFVQGLIHLGFSLVPSFGGPATAGGTESHLVSRFATKLLVGLALDAIREENGQFDVSSTGSVSTETTRGNDVSMSLFTCLLRRQRINEIEKRFLQALDHLIRMSKGQQYYLVSLIKQKKDKKLVIHAKDPIFKHEMSYLLHNDEFLIQDDTLVSSSSSALITETCRPRLHALVKRFLQRVRVDFTSSASSSNHVSPNASQDHHKGDQNNVASLEAYAQSISSGTSHHHTSTGGSSSSGLASTSMSIPFLVLVENERFVQTLRDQLAQAELPFFWSVSNHLLEFSIDYDFFHQMKYGSFQQLVAWAFQQKAPRSVLLYLKSLKPSCFLQVRYEILGRQNVVAMNKWKDFQALLGGFQDTYAQIELRPQGDCFLTSLDRSSQGAPKWNFKKLVDIKEPEKCELRIDRPVVYTDTLQVTKLPDGTGAVKVKFLPPTSNNASSSGGGAAGHHFMIVSVRKALPTGTLPARLYCTAYDPFSSSDYVVEGYPENWTVDFFNPEINPDCEKQWLELVKNMHIGVTLTPKLTLRVFNKQVKTDRVIGECEVSIASAIAHEGHGFEDWFALQDPMNPAMTTGFLHLAFRFDLKTPKQQDALTTGTTDPLSTLTKDNLVFSLPKVLNVPTSSSSSVPASVAGPVKSLESREPHDATASTTELKKRLSELESSLQKAEKQKQEAQEYVKTLEDRMKHGGTGPVGASVDEVNKWKKKFDQAKKEQISQQEDYDKRVELLEQELKRLEKEKKSVEQQQQQQTRQEEVSVYRYEKKSPIVSNVVITNLAQAALGEDASAHDVLSAMKEILISRSRERPYNGLKKALVVVAESPGKISVPAFEDVLCDFGLSLVESQKRNLLHVLDSEGKGRISIEDFFVKLCGDAEVYSTVSQIKPKSTAAQAAISVTPLAATNVVTTASVTTAPIEPKKQEKNVDLSSSTNSTLSSSVPSMVQVPTRPKQVSWNKMKQLLKDSLPEGWEMRFTDKGRPYYCNHATRSTQWKHPDAQMDTEFTAWYKESGLNFTKTTGK